VIACQLKGIKQLQIYSDVCTLYSLTGAAESWQNR